MAPYRLLIIEDEQPIVDLVSRVASQEGFEVRATCNVTQIEAIYDSFVPHVVVLDIVMPEMDGFEVLNLLHQRKSESAVVILSGQAGYRPMASRMAEGFDLMIAATIAKPFRIPELRTALERIRESIDFPMVPSEATGTSGSGKEVAA